MDDTLIQTSLAPYQYTCLAGPSWIRVLQLHSADGFEDELVCNIIHLDRDCLFASTDKTRNYYQTVSYAWGEPNFDTDLVCEEDTSAQSVIKITANVGTMLRYFRKKHKSLNLWIDAVCLNQSDRDEIQQQLQLMGSIFSESAKTRIWLGDSFEGMQEIFAVFRMIVIATQRMGNGLASQNERKIIGDKLCRLPEQSLHEIFRRPWFRRRWILQELYLARNAVMMCGDENIAWKDFAQVVRRSSDFAPGSIWKADVLAHARRLGHQTHRAEAGLLDVLWRHRHHHCSDPRDVIFALLGFAHTYGVNVQYIQYDQPHHLIFRDFAAACISGGQLEVVSDHVAAFGALNKRHEDLPSWIPDWSSRPSRPGFLANSTRSRWLSLSAGDNGDIHCSNPSEHMCLLQYADLRSAECVTERCPASISNSGSYVHVIQQAIFIKGFLSLQSQPQTWQDAVTSFFSIAGKGKEMFPHPWALAPFLLSLLNGEMDKGFSSTSELRTRLSALPRNSGKVKEQLVQELLVRIESLFVAAVAGRVLSSPKDHAFAIDFYQAWLQLSRGGLIFYSEAFRDRHLHPGAYRKYPLSSYATHSDGFRVSRLIGYGPRDIDVGDFVVAPDLPQISELRSNMWSHYVQKPQSRAFLLKTKEHGKYISSAEHSVLKRAMTGSFRKAIPVMNIFEDYTTQDWSDRSSHPSLEYYRRSNVPTGLRKRYSIPKDQVERTLLSSINIL